MVLSGWKYAHVCVEKTQLPLQPTPNRTNTRTHTYAHGRQSVDKHVHPEPSRRGAAAESEVVTPHQHPSKGGKRRGEETATANINVMLSNAEELRVRVNVMGGRGRIGEGLGLTWRSQICSGLLPMLYKIDRNPDWNVFLNMALGLAVDGGWLRADRPSPSRITTSKPTQTVGLAHARKHSHTQVRTRTHQEYPHNQGQRGGLCGS